MTQLTTYEAAWLLGGAQRTALVVLVALATDGRLEVAYKRQRIKILRTEATYPLEAAALALVPASGLGVADFLARVAATEAVADLRAAIRAKGQLRILRRFSPTYRELIADPGTGVRRVAVLGVPGIEDERLRDMLANPLPAMPKIDPFSSVRDNTEDGTIGPSEGTWTGGDP
ncbi:TIGR04222 domain-containing membrane protein [Kribbella sp. NPDC003505]|uniref:TIGR04222 domain-containing membrane protein n=1 Tax=Kribbella sp. NPDC003505 TaxID=3154448 RepID=UPI0033B2294E